MLLLNQAGFLFFVSRELRQFIGGKLVYTFGQLYTSRGRIIRLKLTRGILRVFVDACEALDSQSRRWKSEEPTCYEIPVDTCSFLRNPSSNPTGILIMDPREVNYQFWKPGKYPEQ